jgi:micrococcal nuclease
MKVRLTKKNIALIVSVLLIIFQYLQSTKLFSTSKEADFTKFYSQTDKELLDANINKTKVHVEKVIDGDTIEIENGVKVRYIGIDTPETVHPKKKVQCFGEEASLKNKELVEGHDIYMVADISNTDKYGRLLRYVWLVNDNATNSALFVNRYLVQNGFAYAATFPPDVKYSSVFVKDQSVSRLSKKGLWSRCETN